MFAKDCFDINRVPQQTHPLPKMPLWQSARGSLVCLPAAQCENSLYVASFCLIAVPTTEHLVFRTDVIGILK